MAPPHATYYKLNIDGSALSMLQKYGIGGVFRDSQGHWIMGFAGKSHQATSVHTELLALLMELQIVVRNQLPPIVIKIDAQEIIGMLTTPNMHYTNIINDCRLLLLHLGSPPIHHVYREKNSIVNSLPKYGAKHADGSSCLLFATPPPFVQ